MPKIRIGLVLPDVLGTYGDNGNALVLRQRCALRGIEATVVKLALGDAVPDNLDLYCMGGGEDFAQVLATEHLLNDGGLSRAAANNRPIFAVCAGLQVLSKTFHAHGEIVDGVGLIDATTAAMPSRAIGEVTSRPTLPELTEPLTGFENHLGATILGPGAQPLGTVTRGTGNNVVEHSGEGVVQGSVIATYMHGPALARNPQLADLLIARALDVSLADLEPLTLPEVDRLRSERLRG
ncbi:type 1 glutamine amidotransferase [Corynebacterium aquatimens]|uniref:Lipid II isoglutaminyl synthase (glutamine-hydrolyzing) subunit GatD n=1 Tax=Corynebacterium aquatimens TaxID=1190508 RepID=A0A931GS16_9CORY|nr:glutamine amidotransferase [Corynebacterium aquatimens]MBG6122563.1 CobQ-like glutamine amidotransferase family enzyme [Corynebacterium aquatimens]WJY64897.1 cobyric acid synthase [Corynebacterium aquatimens]